MEILFVCDPLESFKVYKDTTFAMMREAQHRGHTVAACEPRDLVWERGGVVLASVRVLIRVQRVPGHGSHSRRRGCAVHRVTRRG